MSHAAFRTEFQRTLARRKIVGSEARSFVLLVLLLVGSGACEQKNSDAPPLTIPDIAIDPGEGGLVTAAPSNALLDAALDASVAADSGRADAGHSRASSSDAHDASASASTPAVTSAEAVCGNGLLEVNEECDDGNTVSSDGCVACIVVPTCGNQRLEGNEQCDDGNTVVTDGCAGCVVVPLCGNGFLEAGEECDSPDTRVCLRCRAVKIPSCGNGIVEAGEQCDVSSPACVGCRVVVPRCGDGVVDADEQCDDANRFDGDGCDGLCRLRRCGDNVIQDGEQCDPPSASCRVDCTLVPPHCGDGRAQPNEGESCDDGNLLAGDGCFDCDVECGNGVVESELGELCEPNRTTLPCRASIVPWCVPCEGSDCELRDACDASRCQPLKLCALDADTGLDAGPVAPEVTRVCDALFPENPCDDPAFNLLPEGSFDSGLGRFQSGDPRVSLSHVDGDGFYASGALLVVFDNGELDDATEARGATACLTTAGNRRYDFSAAYRFLEGIWQDSGVSVSLFVYPTSDCSGSPVAPESGRGDRAAVATTWTGYTVSVDTAALSADAPASLLVRLDVWRSPLLPKVAVLWDDVSLLDRSVAPSCSLDPEADAGELDPR